MSTPSPRLASVNGLIVPAEDAVIPVKDDGLLRGDGVFEVIHLYNGHPFLLREHLLRLKNSADEVRLLVDQEIVQEEINALLKSELAPTTEGRSSNADGEAQLRVIVTRGGNRLLVVEELPPLPETLTLASIVHTPSILLQRAKTLSYAANMLARRLAQERGADDALLVSPEGHVLETPVASIFLVINGELTTPPLSERILDSLTRRAVLAGNDVHERVCTYDDALGAEEAFVASSTHGILPVHRIDATDLIAPLPPGVIRGLGPVTSVVREKLMERVRREVLRSPHGEQN